MTAKKPPSKAKNKQAEQNSVEYYAELLDQLHLDISSARKRSAFTAVSLLTRQALLVRKQLDLLTQGDGESDPYESMTDEELERIQLAAISDLPDHMIDSIILAVIERRGRNYVASMLGPAELRLMK